MTKQKHTPDKRMLELIDYLKQNGIIEFKQNFYDSIDIHKQSVTKIKNGLQHFTALQIASACKVYNVNANWIIGIEKTIFRSETQTKTSNK